MDAFMILLLSITISLGICFARLRRTRTTDRASGMKSRYLSEKNMRVSIDKK